MSKPRKPYDPAHAAERAARVAEIDRLQKLGATVTVDPAKRIISARRSNVFTLLLHDGRISQAHHDAAARVAELWATAKGMDGRETLGAKVDCGSTPPHMRCLVTDRMMAASLRISLMLAGLSEAHRMLLEAFMVAGVEEDRPMSWRGMVERVLIVPPRKHRAGASDPHLAAVVGMLDALVALAQEPRARRAA